MSYILSRPEIASFEPSDLREASLQYLKLGGKSLRPAILLFSCGAVGGDEEKALAAAAAVEVYHTWTLVHDDIMDRDAKRRGEPTVHEEFRQRASASMGFSPGEAAHYGVSIAIMAGDMLQGWCASLLGNLSLESGCDPRIALLLTRNLMLDTQAHLVAGQVLDVQFEQVPVERLAESDILNMLMGKTSALYEFCGRAGAMIGLDSSDTDDPRVSAIASFASLCGLAFQLQDDILGVIGDEALLGKPVGSDIREGKKTLIVHHALRHAGSSQRSTLLAALGNKTSSAEDVRRAVSVLQDLGSIAYVQEQALAYVAQAKQFMDTISASSYKELLLTWADFMVKRSS